MPVVSKLIRHRRTLVAAAAALAIAAGVTGATAMGSNTGAQSPGGDASIVADAGERLPGYPYPAISSVSR